MNSYLVSGLKEDCCGCEACVQICPVNAIRLGKDNEGFLYPRIDKERCLNCGLCEKLCPVLNPGNERKPLYVYAAKNKNEEIRYKSSSGGIFTMVAEHIIRSGGVVFGARFNAAWEVIHDYTDTCEGLEAFRGSKYVQSNVGNTYKQAKLFLDAGRKVLFSGTPCQIAGLKTFLKQEYDNLLTIDVVCHGVPSAEVWEMYLNEMKDNQNIINVNFRNKAEGWKNYVLSIDRKNDEQQLMAVRENTFMNGFLQNLYLRPSCYACPLKPLKSVSDITIGDYWGVQNILPEFDDNKGVSLVMINTLKGKTIYDKLEKDDRETTYAEAIAGNSKVEESAIKPMKRAVFFKRWKQGKLTPLINKLTRPSIAKKTIVSIFKMIGLYDFAKTLLKKKRRNVKGFSL
jgi:coenzyme F420-reducing hydrogenase beta subunit